MHTGLLHLHSFLRWIILLLLLIVIFRSLILGKKPFTNTDKRLGLFTVISCDLTLLVGLYLWFTGYYGFNSFKDRDMKAIMSDKADRFFSVEHFIGMLLAIILVHIGRSYAKKNIPDYLKHKRTLVFFGLALLIILLSIPWPFRQVARPWF